jgi:hypothetical protein
MGVRVRAVVLACLLGGCGRLGFDARDFAAGDAKGSDSAIASDAADASGNAMIQRWQETAVANTVGGAMLTLGTPSMPGSLLVLAIAANDLSSLGLPSGWTQAATTGSNGACFGLIAYLPNNPGGIGSITYTMSTGAPSVAQLIEIANASTTAPLDAVGQIAASSPVVSQTVSTSTSTTSPQELAVTLFCEDVNMPTYSPAGSAWMRLGTFSNSSSSPSYEAEYSLVPATMVVTATVTSDVAGKYTGLIATFRP